MQTRAEGQLTVNPAGPLVVRDARGVEELRACQALQRRAWGITEDGYVVPVATMAAVQKVGGLVLVAFLGEALVGFSFAFLGRVRGGLVLYSQLTAIEPELQGQGLGRALKLEQRRRAAEMGLDRVAWAFDPLQASNAFFNLAVLGATCQLYEIDLYGSRTDALNAGLATDRLVVEWPTAGELSGQREAWPDTLDLLLVEDDGLGRRPGRVATPPADARHLAVEIPTDVAALKAASLEAARSWQLAVREALLGAFASGYRLVGFAREPRPRHLLERLP